MGEVPNFIEEYNRIVSDAPGPAELFARFPGIQQYLAKAAGELVGGPSSPLSGRLPSGARVQRLGEIVCRALGACVALGVELGYSERATEFVHRLLQESPEPED